MDQIGDDDIDISCTIYSGNPLILIAFDKSFPDGKTL